MTAIQALEHTFAVRKEKCPLCGGATLMHSHRLEAHGLNLQWDRCVDCDFVFQNPALTPDSVRGLYEQSRYFEQAYSNYTDHDGLRLAQSRKRLDRIELLVGSRRGRLLDVGSASGFFGAAARERGYAVTCIEPDERMASYGRSHYGLDVRASTLEECDGLDTASFDLVTLWGTDSHFTHPIRAFERLSELIRPGGHLAMNYQHFHHPIRRVMPSIKVRWNVMFNLSDASFGHLMQRVGLTVIDRIGSEWQLVTLDHLCRHLCDTLRWQPPRFAERVRVSIPAVSFRWVLATKRP